MDNKKELIRHAIDFLVDSLKGCWENSDIDDKIFYAIQYLTDALIHAYKKDNK